MRPASAKSAIKIGRRAIKRAEAEEKKDDFQLATRYYKRASSEFKKAEKAVKVIHDETKFKEEYQSLLKCKPPYFLGVWSPSSSPSPSSPADQFPSDFQLDFSSITKRMQAGVVDGFDRYQVWRTDTPGCSACR